MPRTPAVPKASRKPYNPLKLPALPPFYASRPECLVIWRRRLGLTQAVAAERLEVPIDRVRRWEAAEAKHCPRSRVGRLRTYEICFLLRRRQQLTQAELAALMGVTRLWLFAMEAGTAPVDRLLMFWSFRMAAQA